MRQVVGPPRPLAATPRPSRYLSVYRGPESPARFQVGAPPPGSPKVIAPRGDVRSGPTGLKTTDPEGIPSRETRPIAGGDSTLGIMP
ncbi:MAG: hypothetical protein WKF75_02835 [Singulisphaera sp.]